MSPFKYYNFITVTRGFQHKLYRHLFIELHSCTHSRLGVCQVQVKIQDVLFPTADLLCYKFDQQGLVTVTLKK